MAMHLLAHLTPQERNDILNGFVVARTLRADATHVRTEYGCAPVYYYNRHGDNNWHIWDTSKELWVQLSTPPDIKLLTTREECEEYVLSDQNQSPNPYDPTDKSTWLTKPAWHLAPEDAEYFTPETVTNHARYFRLDDEGNWFTVSDIRYPTEILDSLHKTFRFEPFKWTSCDKRPDELPMIRKDETSTPTSSPSENDIDIW